MNNLSKFLEKEQDKLFTKIINVISTSTGLDEYAHNKNQYALRIFLKHLRDLTNYMPIFLHWYRMFFPEYKLRAVFPTDDLVAGNIPASVWCNGNVPSFINSTFEGHLKHVLDMFHDKGVDYKVVQTSFPDVFKNCIVDNAHHHQLGSAIDLKRLTDVEVGWVVEVIEEHDLPLVIVNYTHCTHIHKALKSGVYWLYSDRKYCSYDYVLHKPDV